ncbi:MAG TPA: LysE family translocator [Chitinophagaceae bacterium]|nr:LysE family translocator [Chitinophagaceae bacterium]
MQLHNPWLFAVASFMLNITPGNDMLYVAARSANRGVKAGIVSSLGICAGCMVHIVAAVVGLSALIAKSAVAFNIIKYVGAGYLIYLGVRTILSKANAFNIPATQVKSTYCRIFWQGVLTNVLNPKVALFFLAFLPQFINVSAPNTWLQILLLGAWFNIGGTVVNIAVSVLFGRLGNWFSKSAWFQKWQNKITGALLVGLGVKVATKKL